MREEKEKKEDGRQTLNRHNLRDMHKSCFALSAHKAVGVKLLPRQSRQWTSKIGKQCQTERQLDTAQQNPERGEGKPDICAKRALPNEVVSGLPHKKPKTKERMDQSSAHNMQESMLQIKAIHGDARQAQQRGERSEGVCVCA